MFPQNYGKPSKQIGQQNLQSNHSNLIGFLHKLNTKPAQMIESESFAGGRIKDNKDRFGVQPEVQRLEPEKKLEKQVRNFQGLGAPLHNQAQGRQIQPENVPPSRPAPVKMEEHSHAVSVVLEL